MMTDIVDEINDDIRQEKYAKLWQKYGFVVVGILVLIVIGTAISVWWENKTLSANQQQGSKVFEAVEAAARGDSSNAIEMFSHISKSDNSTYAAIANLQEASLLINDGQFESAVAAYQSAFTDGSAPKEFKDLAELLYLANSFYGKQVEEEEKFTKRLQTLIDGKSPWRFSATELLAVFHYKKGELDQAKLLFEQIIMAESAPANMKARVTEMVRSMKG